MYCARNKRIELALKRCKRSGRKLVGREAIFSGSWRPLRSNLWRHYFIKHQHKWDVLNLQFFVRIFLCIYFYLEITFKRCNQFNMPRIRLKQYLFFYNVRRYTHKSRNLTVTSYAYLKITYSNYLLTLFVFLLLFLVYVQKAWVLSLHSRAKYPLAYEWHII